MGFILTVIEIECFEAFTAVTFQVEVFWVVTPCSVVVGYQHFGGQCYTLKMATALTSETLMSYHNTRRRHSPEDLQRTVLSLKSC